MLQFSLKKNLLIFPNQNLPEKQGTFRYLNDTRRMKDILIIFI